jgi:hypothetical protein
MHQYLRMLPHQHWLLLLLLLLGRRRCLGQKLPVVALIQVLHFSKRSRESVNRKRNGLVVEDLGV